MDLARAGRDRSPPSTPGTHTTRGPPPRRPHRPGCGLLVVEVEDHLLVVGVLEEALVGAHYLGVLDEALSHARPKADDALDTRRRKERVAENRVGVLADAVHAPGSLHEPNDRPREVVIDDDGGVLEILALAEHVGGDEDA